MIDLHALQRRDEIAERVEHGLATLLADVGHDEKLVGLDACLGGVVAATKALIGASATAFVLRELVERLDAEAARDAGRMN